jgi:hypothetical protein
MASIWGTAKDAKDAKEKNPARQSMLTIPPANSSVGNFFSGISR